LSETFSPETRDLLSLRLVPGLGPRLTAALLDRFGSPGGVLRASPGQLREIPHIGEKLAHDICQAMRAVEVDKELEQMARHGVNLLALGAADYPARLATIADPPHLLFMRGMLTARDGNAVALVGSRSCTTTAGGSRNASPRVWCKPVSRS